jgi:hypothetical protein
MDAILILYNTTIKEYGKNIYENNKNYPNHIKLK